MYGKITKGINSNLRYIHRVVSKMLGYYFVQLTKYRFQILCTNVQCVWALPYAKGVMIRLESWQWTIQFNIERMLIVWTNQNVQIVWSSARKWCLALRMMCMSLRRQPAGSANVRPNRGKFHTIVLLDRNTNDCFGVWFPFISRPWNVMRMVRYLWTVWAISNVEVSFINYIYRLYVIHSSQSNGPF